MKPCVLFVDDEENILMSLKRSLRGMRDQWDIHFVTSGQQALDFMKRTEVHVVVSDMRMPEMDGPTLLGHVMRDYPETVRIALSGYSDDVLVGRAVAPSHRYLSKPCDVGLLIQTIQQGLNARGRIPNKQILRKLSYVEHLPVLPKCYERISQALAAGDPTPKDIADIVSDDVGMAANILKLVNSSYFGIARQVTTLQQAVIYLGVNVIKTLVLSVHIYKCLSQANADSFRLCMLWEHSMRVANAGKYMAWKNGLSPAAVDMAYTSGCLHDIGKLLLFVHCGEEYEVVFRTVRETNRRICDVESEMLGLTHADVGAYLLELWGLPWAVVYAVAAHHTEIAIGPESIGPDIVYCANVIDHNAVIVNLDNSKPNPALDRLTHLGGLDGYNRLLSEVGSLNHD